MTYEHVGLVDSTNIITVDCSLWYWLSSQSVSDEPLDSNQCLLKTYKTRMSMRPWVNGRYVNLFHEGNQGLVVVVPFSLERVFWRVLAA